jgi:hypothetical protein
MTKISLSGALTLFQNDTAIAARRAHRNERK